MKEKDSTFNGLPSWDLSDLYVSPDSKEITKDLNWLDKSIRKFQVKYEDKLKTLNHHELLTCVIEHEAIEKKIGRIMSYAALRYYQKTDEPSRVKFLADSQEKLTAMTGDLVFFSLEFNRIPDHTLKKMMKNNKKLMRYKSAFRRMRANKPHQLSDELEKFIHEKSAVGSSAWNKLFDETMVSLSFKIDGFPQPMQLEEALNLLSDPDRKNRELAARSLAIVFKENISLFTRITNTLTKEKSIEDKWRNFPTPQHSRHLSNDVEPEVVEALRSAVVTSYPKISHRYYKLKAKWMGVDKLEIWDRNAPIYLDDDNKYTWEDSKSIILNAFGKFDERMKSLAEPFFNNNWIDAGLKKGKAPGAFSHPTVSDVHPYILVNFLGKQRDVMTLAHELGHGIHQSLASKQGETLSQTPLTLAETASVFGEMLTFQSLLSNTKNPLKRKILISQKVEDMINTVVRQISFYDFECKLHSARSEGELLPEEINKIWLKISKESLGPTFNFMDGYEVFWAYVPHFIHSPFYVYAYAFGDGLVNALYAHYIEAKDGFQDKYFRLLEAGGSQHHSELLKPFSLDATDPSFWKRGLNLISKMIDELEEMDKVSP